MNCVVSFDHLVRVRAAMGDREPKRLCCFEVDDQLEKGRLLDRQIGRLHSLEDAIDEVGAAT